VHDAQHSCARGDQFLVTGSQRMPAAVTKVSIATNVPTSLGFANAPSTRTGARSAAIASTVLAPIGQHVRSARAVDRRSILSSNACGT